LSRTIADKYKQRHKCSSADIAITSPCNGGVTIFAIELRWQELSERKVKYN